MNKTKWSLRLSVALAVLGAAPHAVGQSNVIAGTDVALGILGEVRYFGRTGAFPNGTSGIAMATTSCNLGSVNVPWLAPMQENHPLIAFMVTRLSDDRLVQISDRSYLKHGFFALSNSQCTPCQNPSGGTFLGVGCSDTYGTGNNGDKYYLGPADEIDPWLGTWTANGSYFDRGLNNLAPDGIRSLTQSQASSLGVVGTRINLADGDLNVPGARFFYQGYYVIKGEPGWDDPNTGPNEDKRVNNLRHKEMTASWTGSFWNISQLGSQSIGTVLNRWPGVTVRKANNGQEDGQVLIGYKVTPNPDGTYHYEYAFHNRDNKGGIDSISLPVCAGARITNFGFHDVDTTLADWTFSVTNGTMTVEDTAGNNPLKWNMMFNMWFDSDAAPLATSVSLGVDNTPAGAASSFDIGDVMTPSELYNVYTGAGCSTSTVPTLVANGRATDPNPTFALESEGNAAGASCALFFSLASAQIPIGGGCDLLVSVPFGNFTNATADGTGKCTFPAPVPADPAVEGLNLYFQSFELAVGTGAYGNIGNLSDGLHVRGGTNIGFCPN